MAIDVDHNHIIISLLQATDWKIDHHNHAVSQPTYYTTEIKINRN